MIRPLMSFASCLALGILFLFGCSDKHPTAVESTHLKWIVTWIKASDNNTPGFIQGNFVVKKWSPYGCGRDVPNSIAVALDNVYYHLTPYELPFDKGWTTEDVLLEAGKTYIFKIIWGGVATATIDFTVPHRPVFDTSEAFNPAQENVITWSLARDCARQYISVHSNLYDNNLHDSWSTAILPTTRSVTIPANALESFGTDTVYRISFTQGDYITNDEVFLEIWTYNSYTYPPAEHSKTIATPSTHNANSLALAY